MTEDWCSTPDSVLTGSGDQRATKPVGTVEYFPGCKRPEREADDFLPSSSEVKNSWS